MLRNALPGLKLTWVEHPGDALAQIARATRPDLLLMLDSGIHGEGRALIANARRHHRTLRVAVYGGLGRVDCDRWLDAGCDGVLARDVPAERFVEALRFVLEGNAYVAPQLIASGPDAISGCAFLGTCGLGSPLLDQIPAPVVLMLADRYLHINEMAATLVGYERVELLLKHPVDIVVEAHRAFIGAALQGWLRGAPVDRELVVGLTHKSGALVWVASSQRMVNVGGRPAVLLVCSDLTARLAGQDAALLLSKTPKELAADLMVSDRSLAAGRPAWGPGSGVPDLTSRQQQVLDLLARGASNKRIAGQLGISEATVKLHVHRLLRALRARDRIQAVGFGRKLGLITP